MSDPVGSPVLRVDGRAKVTGLARYAGDVALPGMVHAVVVRSPFPAARILAIDLGAARAASGVVGTLEARDLPARRGGHVIRDVPVLARDRVCHAGERVAAVAAETMAQAEAAAALVSVTFEPGEPVTDPQLAASSPPVHPDTASFEGIGDAALLRNVQMLTRFGHGDVEAAIEAAACVVTETYSTSAVHQMHLEPHVCVVDATGSRVRVWTSNKAPFAVRRMLAQVTDLTEADIVIEDAYVGGDFGAKAYLMDEAVAFFLSRRVGRPVRIAMTFPDEFQAGNPRHPATVQVALAGTSTGELTALSVEAVFDGGAYAGYKPQPQLSGIGGVAAAYAIPNVRVEARCVCTNNTPGGYMRAPAGPQLAFAVESAIDLWCRRAGLDPAAVRERNVVRSGQRSASGETWVVSRAPDVWAAAQAAGRDDPAGPDEGIGFAMGEKHIGGGRSGTLALLCDDGTIEIRTGAVDPGTGTLTILQQIAARETGVPADRVRVSRGNTDSVPFDSGSAATRVTHVAGRATQAATRQLMALARALAADALEVPVELLSGTDDGFQVSETGTRMTLAELARLAFEKSGAPLSAQEDYASPLTGEPVFVAARARVGIDPETGAVCVRRLTLVQEAGIVINPVTAAGQVEGGAVQALGMAISECIQREAARPLTANLDTYRIPAMGDVPPLEVVWVTGSEGPGPFGAKPVAEVCVIPVAAAIANAVFAATDVQPTRLPIDPAALLHLMSRRPAPSPPG